MAVALVMGNMIGSGVFLLPASLAPFGGLSLAGWLVSTAGALCLGLVFARLARFVRATGGPYAYTRRAFGDLPGFLVAWGYWIATWSGNAALAVAFVGSFDAFLPGVVRSPPSAALLAVATVWLLTAVNAVGIRASGWVQAVTTVLKVLPLALVGVAGCLAFAPAQFAVADTSRGAILHGVTASAALTLWAFLGLESATIPAGSIARPERTIPRATIVGTFLSAIIFIVSTIGVMSVVPRAELAQATAPFADAARVLFGDGAAKWVALGAAISCFGALNGWILLAGQMPLAIAQDGLFPRVFGRVSKAGTPVRGLVISAALTSALIAANYTRGLVDLFTRTILLSTLSTLVPYAFSAAAVLVIAREPGNRAGASAGATIVACLAFVYALWAIGGAGADVVYWGFLLLLAGLPVYVAGGRGTGLFSTVSGILGTGL